MENSWASWWSDSYLQAREFSLFSLDLIVLYTIGLGAIFSVSASEPFDGAFEILSKAITFGSSETSKWIISRRRQQTG